ncbi:Ubiquitin-activating enzyme like [Melia azedarach]|uniref:Ubiquitin-activating enzyme like n=1 Tax=Melia azedarach TaxID=155640 RepID=A0ACC1XVT9_MELAZ|nr:Ubiquitin-activating enzyme like [Melia azedarach]
MSDIAMLVAEEYERRVKSCSRKQENNKKEENAVHVVKLSIRKFVGDEKMNQFVRWVLEPKSEIGAAASVGFFSA